MNAADHNRADGDELTPPVVAAEVYDTEYFLRGCLGSATWRASDGAELDPMYGFFLEMVGFEPGDRLLDVGCGRGEMVRLAAERGASFAAGVDYSAAAIELCHKTFAQAEELPVEALQADARRLPFDEGSFDAVTMTDVVEHLVPAELARALAEARRVLRPGGRIFVHTAPNKLIYTVGYRVMRALHPRGRSWPRDPRNDYEREMHVNELRMGTLERALAESGFVDLDGRLGGWVYVDFLPDDRSRRIFRAAARIPLLDRLVTTDLLMAGKKPN